MLNSAARIKCAVLGSTLRAPTQQQATATLCTVEVTQQQATAVDRNYTVKVTLFRAEASQQQAGDV